MNFTKKKAIISVIAIIVLLLIYVMYLSNKNKIKSPVEIIIPDYYSLSEFYYEGEFNKFSVDVYNWYKKIENNDGIYLINTTYFDDDILDIWRENQVYNSIPDKAFWYFRASPSYIKNMGINVSHEEITNAKDGVRLYLLPDMLSEEEMGKMKSYLEEDALKNAKESSIKTTFTEEQEIKFITYTPDRSYFTWYSEKGEPLVDKAPVIYVCTSENMKYFESESLTATELDSYVKFESKESLDNSVDDILENYNLKFLKSSEIYKKAEKYGRIDREKNQVFK